MLQIGRWLLAVVFGVSGLAAAPQAAVTIIIANLNSAGTGFNDPTPVAPIGGNPGTTRGQQAGLAVQYATNIWGATLTSTVVIEVWASVVRSASSCTGVERAVVIYRPSLRNFPFAPFADTQYPPALANKIAGVDLRPGESDFELRICVDDATYMGLDGNHGAQTDLVDVIRHAFAHGVGFTNPTALASGAFEGGFPSVWDRFVLDTTTGKLWVNMTLSERQASMINTGHVVWTGPNVTNGVTNAYSAGVMGLSLGGPEAGAVAGEHFVGLATFGTPLGATPFGGQLMPIQGSGCTALGTLDALAVQSNVALVDRGGCADVVKAKNVQNAGAIAVILIDGSSAVPPPGPTGADASVTIRAVAISTADGNALDTALLHRGRRASGVTASLHGGTLQYLGADPLGRALIYTPGVLAPTAPTHFDPSATPDQLMEPSISGSVTQSVPISQNLTFQLLQDIGW